MNKRIENLMIFTVVGVAAFLIFGKKKKTVTAGKGRNGAIPNFNNALGFAGGSGGSGGNLQSTQHVADSGASSDTGSHGLISKLGGLLDNSSVVLDGGSGGVTSGDTGLGGWGQIGDDNGGVRCFQPPCNFGGGGFTATGRPSLDSFGVNSSDYTFTPDTGHPVYIGFGVDSFGREMSGVSSPNTERESR